MPDSAVVARGRRKAQERGTTSRRRAVRQPLSSPPAQKTAKKAAAPAVADEHPLYAETEEVVAFAEGLPEKYLHCRELGHQWKPWSARQVEDSIERILRCPRCRCERHQILTMTGGVYSNKYVHPEGYLHAGMGRIIGEGRDALRMESIKRTIASTDNKKRAA